VSLLSLLLKDLLFVFETEELLTVLEESLQEVLVLGIVDELVEFLRDMSLLIFGLLLQLASHLVYMQ